MRFNWTGPTPTATTTDGETVEKYNFQICSDPAGNCVLDPVTGYGTGNYRGTVTSLPQVTMAVNGIDPNTDVHVRVQSRKRQKKYGQSFTDIDPKLREGGHMFANVWRTLPSLAKY